MATPSDVVASRVREIRQKRRLTVVQLAERCAELGMPGLTDQAIYNIETGRPDSRGQRRRAVSVDELIALAYALQVSPLDLVAPVDDDPAVTVAATGTIEVPRDEFRGWARGDQPLNGMDERLYYAELPPEEWRRALERRRGREEGGTDG